MRNTSHQKAKNIVEQKAQEHVIQELELFAETAPAPVCVKLLIKRRIARLFPKQSEEKLSLFVDAMIAKDAFGKLPLRTKLVKNEQHEILDSANWFRFYSELVAELICEFGDCFAYNRYEQSFEDVPCP